MKILMLAPEPIFEPRGTPLSVVGRLKALSDMGHGVDLLTYPLGCDVHFPGLRIFRTCRIPGMRRVKIGPSLAKIPLDLLLFGLTLVRLLRSRYDAVHSHEEAGLWGLFLARLFGIPHIYDMHSSLPQQMTNFRFSDHPGVIRFFQSLEAWVLKYSRAVITICPDLFEHVRRLPGGGSFLIENVVDYGMIFGEKDESGAIQKRYGLTGKKVVLYAGTFEPYQGIDLITESGRTVIRKDSRVRFMLVGGNPAQVAEQADRVRALGLLPYFIFTGQVQPQEVGSYIRVCDVLLSPRMSGTNTPLKIYSYLKSGKPVVATRLWTHTQVLDDRISVLTEPRADAFARGILSLLENPAKGRRIAEKARKTASLKYGYGDYCDKLSAVLGAATRGGG
ncbi:glycosyltransferase [bacterium]|nr:glycosyltransferase [bacterium]